MKIMEHSQNEDESVFELVVVAYRVKKVQEEEEAGRLRGRAKKGAGRHNRRTVKEWLRSSKIEDGEKERCLWAHPTYFCVSTSLLLLRSVLGTSFVSSVHEFGNVV